MKEKVKIERRNNRFDKPKNAIKGNQKEIKAHVHAIVCQPDTFYLNTLIDCELIKTFNLAIFLFFLLASLFWFEFNLNHNINRIIRLSNQTKFREIHLISQKEQHFY